MTLQGAHVHDVVARRERNDVTRCPRHACIQGNVPRGARQVHQRGSWLVAHPFARAVGGPPIEDQHLYR